MRKIQYQEPYKVYTVWIKHLPEQLHATQEEDKARARILKEYKEFLPMFKEEAYKKLPKH